MLLSGYFPNENIRNLALCVNAAEGRACSSTSCVKEIASLNLFPLQVSKLSKQFFTRTGQKFLISSFEKGRYGHEHQS